jgi:rhodanese-related sulfurtransferase
MRVTLSLILTLASLVALHSACRREKSQPAARQNSSAVEGPSAAVAAATPDDGLRRITVAELRAALMEDRAVVLDVRGSVEYDMSHIQGALLLPLGQVATRARELPREKLIVTYCACQHEGLSGRAVEELKKQGIENAGALLGGLDAWRAAGLPVESTNGSQK